MSFEESIEKMKRIQSILLQYLEEEINVEENYENFLIIISEQKINNDKSKLKELLRLINKIGNNHQRVSNLIDKIEQILKYFKKAISKYFSNSEIFEIFKGNKRILLFHIQEKIMIFDEYIYETIKSGKYLKYKYPQYFASLSTQDYDKTFRKDRYSTSNYVIEKMMERFQNNFSTKKKGENDDYLCKIIRYDNVKAFNDYTMKNNISLQSYIKESPYETNVFLLKKNEIKLVEYAAFFGSLNLIRYMNYRGVKLTSRMWEFAIHSRNTELIKYLEDKHVPPPRNNYESILKESIKCHHNDIANYIILSLINEKELSFNIENNFYENLYRYSVKYNNYWFFPKNIKYKFLFHYLCEFDYYILVKLYVDNEVVNMSCKIAKNDKIFYTI